MGIVKKFCNYENKIGHFFFLQLRWEKFFKVGIYLQTLSSDLILIMSIAFQLL